MKNQTEYYINVYKWRDLPQGIYTIYSNETAERSIEDAMAAHWQTVKDFNGDWQRAEYLTTHTHNGEINLLAEILEREGQEEMNNEKDVSIMRSNHDFSPLSMEATEDY